MNLSPVHKEKTPFGRVIINMTRKISSQIPHETILPTLTNPTETSLAALKMPETDEGSEKIPDSEHKGL